MRARDRVCKPPRRIPKNGIWVWVEDGSGVEHCVFFHPELKWVGSIFHPMGCMSPEEAYNQGYKFKRKST